MGNFVQYKNFYWHYQLFGTGKEIMLAFHGYSRDSSDFKILESSLGKKYTVVAFDLFYHGKSCCPEKYTSFLYDDLKGLILAYLIKNNIERFSLAGYSMGGRIALAITELFPNRINDVFLFAPDGIKNNRLYHKARQLPFVQQVYQHIIVRPRWFFIILHILKNIFLLKNPLHKIVLYQLGTRKRRQKIFDVYKIFEKIYPDIPSVQKILNSQPVQLHLFYGKYDPIEPVSRGVFFVKGLVKKEVLHTVNMGHWLINKRMNVLLEKMLSGNN